MYRAHKQHASLALPQARQRLAHQHHPRRHVGVEHVEQSLLIQFVHRIPVHVPRVADQGVEAASVFHGRPDHGGAVGDHGHVPGHGPTPVPDTSGQTLYAIWATTGDGHPCPPPGQVLGRPRANARTAPGDQDGHPVDGLHRTANLSGVLLPSRVMPWPIGWRSTRMSA